MKNLNTRWCKSDFFLINLKNQISQWSLMWKSNQINEKQLKNVLNLIKKHAKLKKYI